MTPTRQRTFGARAFGGPGITPLSLGIPTAAYPGRVATNSDLIVAVDRQQTSLLLALNASATSMTVLDPSMIVAYSLLSIDNEIVKTTGPQAGNVIPISRGFDGTVPAAHAANALVSGLVDAYHHNALVSEIEAIETALGPNLSHVTAASLPFLVSTAFQFAPQAPGGALIAGNNSISLSPVPNGVNGSDVGHYLYISGGTGAAEAALITGGTAVSGAPSGTLIVQCANSHSGAWTVRTATAGIQEAVSAAQTAGQGLIFVPAGSYTVQATVTVSGSSVKIRGAGRRATLVSRDVTLPAFDIFTLFGSSSPVGNEVSGMSLGLTAAAAAGLGVRATNQSNMLLRDLDIQTPSGIRLTACGYSNIEDSMMMLIASSQTGIYVTGGLDISFQNIYLGSASSSTPGFAAIYIDGGSVFFFNTVDAINLSKGVYIAAANSAVQFLWFDNCVMDTMTGTAWQVFPVANAVVTIVCVNCWAATSGTGAGVELNGTAAAIYGFKWIGGRVYYNGDSGFKLNGNVQDTQISSSTIAGNAKAASGSEILIGSGASKVSITDNLIGQADAPVGPTYWNPVTPTPLYGVDVGGAPIDNLVITDNRFTGGYVNGPMRQNSTGTHNVIARNAGIDNQVPGTIAAAAAIAIPNTGASVFYVTGTAAISTISAGNVGQSLSLIFTNATPGGVAAGGNIAKAIPATQNQRITGVFDGTNWYF